MNVSLSDVFLYWCQMWRAHFYLILALKVLPRDIYFLSLEVRLAQRRRARKQLPPVNHSAIYLRLCIKREFLDINHHAIAKSGEGGWIIQTRRHIVPFISQARRLSWARNKSISFHRENPFNIDHQHQQCRGNVAQNKINYQLLSRPFLANFSLARRTIKLHNRRWIVKRLTTLNAGVCFIALQPKRNRVHWYRKAHGRAKRAEGWRKHLLSSVKLFNRSMACRFVCWTLHNDIKKWRYGVIEMALLRHQQHFYY